jgi:hypothetical protein
MGQFFCFQKKRESNKNNPKIKIVWKPLAS